MYNNGRQVKWKSEQVNKPHKNSQPHIRNNNSSCIKQNNACCSRIRQACGITSVMGHADNKLYIYIHIQGVPGGMDKIRENVPYVKIHRYNLKHLYPKLNGYGDNGQRSLKL